MAITFNTSLTHTVIVFVLHRSWRIPGSTAGKMMNYIRVGWDIAPMGGAKRAPLILANLELCGSIWRSNDSLQHAKDLSTDEDVLI